MSNRYHFNLFSEAPSICFVIVADSEAKAVTAAYRSLNGLIDGIGAEDTDEATDVRIYLDKVPTKKELKDSIVDVTMGKEA